MPVTQACPESSATRCVGWGRWVKEDRNLRQVGDSLFEQFETFSVGLAHEQRQAGDIAAGPPNTSHVVASNWVRVAGKNDRDCGCRSPRRLGVDGTRGHD